VILDLGSPSSYVIMSPEEYPGVVCLLLSRLESDDDRVWGRVHQLDAPKQIYLPEPTDTIGLTQVYQLAPYPQATESEFPKAWQYEARCSLLASGNLVLRRVAHIVLTDLYSTVGSWHLRIQALDRYGAKGHSILETLLPGFSPDTNLVLEERTTAWERLLKDELG
jgi:hypothetical protein